MGINRPRGSAFGSVPAGSVTIAGLRVFGQSLGASTRASQRSRAAVNTIRSVIETTKNNKTVGQSSAIIVPERGDVD